jgi:hypothetical protein
MMFHNPFEVPADDSLIEFVRVQGTRLVLDALTMSIRENQKRKIDEGEIDPYIIDITTNVNNRIDSKKKLNEVASHFCKVPDKNSINSEKYIKDRCFLNEMACAAVFIRKVTALASENPAFKDEKSYESTVCKDLRQKASIGWLDKAPLHTCSWNITEDKIQCDCIGGLTHWSVLDAILSSTSTHCIDKTNLFRIITKENYDPHLFIPWRNDIGELVFNPITEEERINGTGNCIDASVQLSSVRLTNFCGISGLSIDMLVLSISDIYFCPSGHPTQGPHICHIMDCDIVLSNGCTSCALTGIAMRDRRGDWIFDKRVFKVDSVDKKESKDIQDCYNYVFNTMTQYKGGVPHSEMSDINSEMFNDVVGNIKTIEQLNRYQSNSRNTSSQRTMSEKKKRSLIKDALLRIGTEDAKKMAITGHFSDYYEYEKEAYLTVMKILQFGEKSTRAMLIDMEKAYNLRCNIDNKTNGLSIGQKQKKITLVIEGKKDLSRKRITTNDRLRLEYAPEKKRKGMIIQYTGYNGSSSLTVTGEMSSSADNDIFEEEIKEIDESDVTKNKDKMISALAKAGLRFWALIRVRTEMGKNFPNEFNFYTFIYAFLYLKRDGYKLNTGIAGTGDIISFFSPDIFLKHALPADMSDLKKLGYSSNVKKDVKSVYQNIKKAIHEEVVENNRSYIDLDPYMNTKLDFSIDSKEFPPSIFVSLQLKKSG